MPSLRQSITPGASQLSITRSEPRGKVRCGRIGADASHVKRYNTTKGVLNMHESTHSGLGAGRKSCRLGVYALTCLQKQKATDHVDLLLQGACRCHTAPQRRATPHRTAPACLRCSGPSPQAGPWGGELAWPKEVERAARVGLVGWDAGGEGVQKPSHSVYHFSKPSISSAAESLGLSEAEMKVLMRTRCPVSAKSL